MPSLTNPFSTSPKKKADPSVPSSPSKPPPLRPSPSPASKRSHHSSKSSYPLYPDLSRKKHPRTHSNYEDVHPLNLPPAERDRRLSAMSTTSGSSSPVSTADKPSQSREGSHEHFERNGDRNPTPPPHRSPPPARRPSIIPEDCKALGNKYFKAKDYNKAIAEYTRGKSWMTGRLTTDLLIKMPCVALSVEPDSVTYLSNRAAAYMSAHRYEEALEDSKRASQIDPHNFKVLNRLARILTSLGRPAEALGVFDQLTTLAEVSTQDKGPAASMQAHIRQAEQGIQESTSGSLVIHALDRAEGGLGFGVQKPRKWQLMRGEAYLKMGNINSLGQAQDVSMTLLRKNQADPEALVLRGRVFYSQGDNPKALQHFKQALNCDPDYKDAVKYLRLVQKLDRVKDEGNDLYKSGKKQQAVEVYTQALEIDPSNKLTNSKILHNRALAYNKLKQYRSALSDCDRALTLDPSFTKARKTRATALGESGDWENSVREWKELLEQHPEEAEIKKNIRHAELELKKSKRKDLYKILGIGKDASDNEIKKAYRKLAIVHHPDKNAGDETAAERFKDIGEAYETLSDPEKRSRYDRGEDLIDPSEMFAQQGGMGGFPMGGGMGGMQIDPEMLYNMMNGGGGRGGPGFASFSTGGGGMPGGGGGRRRGGGGGFANFPGF